MARPYGPQIEFVDDSSSPEEPWPQPRMLVGVGGIRCLPGSLLPPSQRVWVGSACQAILPGPIVAPSALLAQGWPRVDDAAATWIRQCALLDQSIQLWAIDHRAPEDDFWTDEALVEYARLLRRGRPRSDWEDVNRFLLPRAEAVLDRLPFPTGKDHVAVVGAQRTGTTWMTMSLRGLANCIGFTEEMSVDVLIDGFLTPQVRANLLAWHCTFLTSCPRLLSLLAKEVRIIVMFRDPHETVWSLLNHFGGLPHVIDLLRRLGHRVEDLERSRQAIQIVEIAWQNILSLVEDSATNVKLVQYEDLVASPKQIFGDVARWLGRPVEIWPVPNPIVFTTERSLDATISQKVEDTLQPLHARLRRHYEAQKTLI